MPISGSSVGRLPLSGSDWRSDATLAPEIKPPPIGERTASELRAVLLTGATGFLGAHVLYELLQRTTAKIYCLVRSNSDTTAAERLGSQLTQLRIPIVPHDPRVQAIAGDLSKPLLGLSLASFHDLAASLDAIYHCGGQVHFGQPYQVLHPTNVMGIHEILRMAALETAKPVHSVSTLALFFNKSAQDPGCVSEYDSPQLALDERSGYLQSKWVAERLLLIARERGMGTCIYRTGRISAHSQTGAANGRDLLNNLVKGCLLLGAFPSLDIELSLAPVDYISQAIVHLSLQSSCLGKDFHLVSPHPVPWRAFMQMVGSQGYSLSEMDYEAWLTLLKRTAAMHAERESLIRLWMVLHASNHLLSRRPRYTLPNSSAGLAGSGICCPAIDTAYLGRFLSYLQTQRSAGQHSMNRPDSTDEPSGKQGNQQQ